MKLWFKLLMRDVLVVVAAIACFALLVSSLSHKAHAHNPQTHQPDALSSAYSDAYGKCCSGFDYNNLRTEEWEPTATGWRVKWHGQWLDVPRSAKVKNMTNPDGDAKVWVYGEPSNTYVRCFLPGAMM